MTHTYRFQREYNPVLLVSQDRVELQEIDMEHKFERNRPVQHRILTIYKIEIEFPNNFGKHFITTYSQTSKTTC